MLPTHPHFDSLAAHPLHEFMGIEFHSGHEGRSHLSFVVTDRMLTPAPALHAGFLYSACDLASYTALLSVLGNEEGAVTHDIHVSVMRSGTPDTRVDIKAEIIKWGRTLAFLEARASTGDRLLATARITKSITAA